MTHAYIIGERACAYEPGVALEMCGNWESAEISETANEHLRNIDSGVLIGFNLEPKRSRRVEFCGLEPWLFSLYAQK